MMFKWNSSDALALPIALGLIIICAVVLWAILRNKSEKLRSLPLKILAVLIVFLEASKQIYYNVYQPFTYYILPLHFCSTFIWLMPLAQFTKGRVARFFKPMPLCYAIVVMVLIYAYPHVLLGDATSDIFGSFHNTHTFLYHHIIVAYFIFSFALKDYVPGKKDLLPLVAGVIFYAAYAIPAAYSLNVNYVNILTSDFAPFEWLRLNAGQAVYNIVLFLVAVSAIMLIWGAIFLSFRLASKRRQVNRTA